MAAIHERHSDVTAIARPRGALSDDELHLSTTLYQAIACGHERLAFNVAGTWPLWRRGGLGGRRWEPVLGCEIVPPGEWRPCLEVRADGTTMPRRFNPFLVAGHVRGNYDLAPAAPSWCGWGGFDIDAQVELELMRDDTNEVIPDTAFARALADRDARLAEVWRAFGWGKGREPLLERTPGLGLRAWIPLTRGPASPLEHTWPAHEIVERVSTALQRHGIKLVSGRLEFYPSGRPLRAPCGRRTLFLEPTRPDDADDLGLVPVPGTSATRHRTFDGERYPYEVRRPWRTVAAFVERWQAARRPLEDWIGEPLRAWSPVWGPFEHPDRTLADAEDREKNPSVAGAGECPSQHIDEVQGVRVGRPRGCGVGQGGRAKDALLALDPSGRSGSNHRSPSTSSATSPRSSTVAGGARPLQATLLRRGREFREHLAKLIQHGVTMPSSRHDAVLSLVFWWHVEGKTEVQVRAALEAWVRAFPHVSRLRGERFAKTSLREGMHYYQRIRKLPQRARALVTAVSRTRPLAPADFLLLTLVREDVRDEAHAILEYLAGHADDAGRVGAPVTLGRAQLDALMVSDRRVPIDGKGRHRAEVVAIRELERLGVLTLFCDYSTGHHGRIFSCWYQFGSGVVAPERSTSAQDAPGAAKAPELVVARRSLRVGVLHVLAGGGRRRPRVELDPGPGVVVEREGGASWWRDMFERRNFTPGEVFDADEAIVVAGPWPWRGPHLPRVVASRPELAPPELAPPELAVGGSYDPPAPELAPPAPESDGRATLAAELGVDVATLGDMDPELAALAVHALRKVTPRA